MSIQAVAWVLEHSTTKGAHRLVLIALANHLDERGQCYPSIERIASEANITPVHAKRTLVELERTGHIAKQVNAAPDERMRRDRRPNLYTVLDGSAQKLPPWLDGGNNGARTGVTTARGRGASEMPPNHQLEPSLKPSTKTQPSANADAPEIEALCDELAARIQHHHETATRPAITALWLKDMRLLAERGPLKREKPEPFPPERIRKALEVIFERLNEPDRSKFCWADQIRSPHNLRKHLDQIALAAKRASENGTSRGGRSVDRAAARLAGTRPALELVPGAAR